MTAQSPLDDDHASSPEHQQSSPARNEAQTTAPPAGEMMSKLEELIKLRRAGLVTVEEQTVRRRKIFERW